MHGESTKGNVLKEEVKYVFQYIFGTVFFQTYSLCAAVNFTKIKHRSGVNTKLLALEIYAVSCAYKRG